MRFFDAGLSDPTFRAALDRAYARVLDSGWFIMGAELEAFEAEFASYCEASHTVGVGNGFDALVLALRAAGIGPGAEVVVPAHTFAATWMAVTQVGARPVGAEVDPATYTLSVEAAAAAITPRTAAIIPVSLYGHPAPLDDLMRLAERHGLFVLEDAAQAHGATLNGRRSGSIAHATAFSFYPTKNLGALGDGGAVVTQDAALAASLRRLRNYGSDTKYLHAVEGVNSRLDELQAAFLRVRLGGLDAANDKRRALAAAYNDLLRPYVGLTPPAEAQHARHVYHLYVVRSAARDALQAGLRSVGIETLIHYPVPCHLQPAFAALGYRAGDFPFSEQLAAEVLSLPFWPGMAHEDAAAVAGAIASYGA